MDNRCAAAPRCAHVPSQRDDRPTYRVRLADGFVCFVTDVEHRAFDVAARHEGASVEGPGHPETVKVREGLL